MSEIAFKDIQGDLFCQYPLAKHTSWHVGGEAEFCYYPASLQDLQEMLTQVPQAMPVTWLGLGSNVLIRENGIPGVVIITLNRLNQLALVEDTLVRVEAGVTCAKLAKFCVRHGFEAGAFFAGIPGTVGGALAMNAGAFKGETWSHVEAVETLSRNGTLLKRVSQEFQVQYRHVDRDQNEYFAAGYFRFQRGDPEIAKQHLQSLLKKRNYSQPIGTFSCGSVFRNPDGDFAARLIEQTGLKGYQIGGAQVSAKHANFILNCGGASAREIEALIEYVKEQVHQCQGVKLVPEVHILGIR